MCQKIPYPPLASRNHFTSWRETYNAGIDPDSIPSSFKDIAQPVNTYPLGGVRLSFEATNEFTKWWSSINEGKWKPNHLSVFRQIFQPYQTQFRHAEDLAVFAIDGPGQSVESSLVPEERTEVLPAPQVFKTL